MIIYTPFGIPKALCCAVPCRAVLCCAVLCCAVLCCSVLCCAVLCCAFLCCAVLCCAMLGWAELCCFICTSTCWLQAAAGDCFCTSVWPIQLLYFIVQVDDADALSTDAEEFQASKTAMESALAGPSAAHPVEGYGTDNLSLAKVCTFAEVAKRTFTLMRCVVHAHVFAFQKRDDTCSSAAQC